MILLNKASIGAVLAAVSTEKSRYTLKGIHVTEKHTEATNGHLLLHVTHPRAEVKDFPAIPGFAPNGFKPVILPLDAAVAIHNAIPKKSHIPILSNAAISVSEAGEISAAVTDLESPQVFNPKPLAGQFPNSEPVLAKQAPLAEITLNPSYLKAIAEAAIKLQRGVYQPSIKLRLYGSDKAMLFSAKNDDGQELTGALMPMRD